MKKLVSLLLTAAVTISALVAAPTISEPVELKAGTDYTIETSFYGDKYFTIDGNSIHFNKGANNGNHAVVFKFTDPSIIPANAVIEIEYTMGKYDSKKSCQVVIQPTSDKAADYGKQNYPILWNNYEPDNPPVITVDCDRLLTSSVKKNLIGFRICNNDGSYEKYKWQSDWGFTITKVTLKPKN